MREKRPESGEYLNYYAKYVQLVPDGDIVTTLGLTLPKAVQLYGAIGEEHGGHRYAAGKWSIRQVLGHICDVERVMAYRALSFARADVTELPGFEENDWAENAGSEDRTLASLIDEFKAVRAATIALFGGLTSEAWSRAGKANRAGITVRSLAWIIAGHELHHRNIIREKYLASEVVAQ